MIDPSFNAFADYAANLVRYYNLGSFTTGGVTYTNPNGTSHRIVYWELWNEPDLSFSSPCTPTGNPALPSLTSTQYATMWDVVTARMLAVDPGLKFIGGVISNPSTSYSPDYIANLISGTHMRSGDIVSFHAYGGPVSFSDLQYLTGFGGYLGLAGIVNGVKYNISLAANSSLPGREIWVDETNLTADYLDEDAHQRPWTAFGTAFGAAVFQQLAFLSINNPISLFRFQMVEPDFNMSLLNYNNGQPLLPYWREYYLTRNFPAGSEILYTQSTSGAVSTLAVRLPDSRVEVMIVNTTPTAAGDVGGGGYAQTISLSLTGLSGVSSAQMWTLDSTTNAVAGPTPVSLTAQPSAQISLAGYGVTFLEFTP